MCAWLRAGCGSGHLLTVPGPLLAAQPKDRVEFSIAVSEQGWTSSVTVYVPLGNGDESASTSTILLEHPQLDTSKSWVRHLHMHAHAQTRTAALAWPANTNDDSRWVLGAEHVSNPE